MPAALISRPLVAGTTPPRGPQPLSCLPPCRTPPTAVQQPSYVRTPHPAVQSEYGDIYKVTLSYEGERVAELKIKYFDTIPPCSSICVLKTGFLFAASEYGNHALYQFIVSTVYRDHFASVIGHLDTGTSSCSVVVTLEAQHLRSHI